MDKTAYLLPSEIENYFKRLHIGSASKADDELLSELHVAHLKYIPYENLDIINGLDFNLHPQVLFQKLIVNQRGGFCYELNILFEHFLTSLGYKTHLITSRINGQNGLSTNVYDHPLILVHLDDLWLADVGNSKWFTRPLKIIENVIQKQGGRQFKLVMSKDMYSLFEILAGEHVLLYHFNLDKVRGEDFTSSCREKWTTPNSKFTSHYILSKFDNNQRILLKDNLCTIISDFQQIQSPLQNIDEFKEQVDLHFGENYGKLIFNT